MKFYIEPVIKMFDHLKIKILKAGFKRTVQFYQISIKNVFLTHLSQFQPTIANKTKEKKYVPTFFRTPSTMTISGLRGCAATGMAAQPKKA